MKAGVRRSVRKRQDGDLAVQDRRHSDEDTLRAHLTTIRLLRFLISGKPTDGRKGHMIALAAFHEFMKAYYERDPGTYRPFTLTLVGMTDDYIAEQIRSIGSNILGERLRVHPERSS